MRTCFFLLLILGLLQSCANQTQPTGGPKDEDPPVLLESIPEDGQRNYTSTEIILTFDENITLNNPKNQLLITPRTAVEYDIDYRRNQVTIKFDSALDANTTYTFSFRKSIVDLTEKNSPEDLQIAFSTGPELDTLLLQGSVVHALTGIPPDNATVVLYRESDTTNIFDGLPYYFTTSSDSGKFTLRNLKEGNYRIYAINDYNSNLTAETGSEPYAFHNSLVHIDSVNEPVNLRLVNLDLDSLRNLSGRKSGSGYLVKYNKAIVDYKVDSANNVVAYRDLNDPTLIRVQSTVPIAPEDSAMFTLYVQDSLGLQLTNNFYGQFEPQSSRKEPFSVIIDPQPILVNDPYLRYRLRFTKPSRLSNADSLFLRIDSLHIYTFDSTHLRWNRNNTELSIDYLLDKSLFQRQETPRDTLTKSAGERSRQTRTQRETPTFRIGRGAFVSIEYDTAKKQQEYLEFLTQQDVSTFILQLSNTPDHPLIIQFLTTPDRVMYSRTVSGNGSYTFNNITPSTYTIRVILDQNSNGKWDPGNFYLGEQPEIIYVIKDKSGKDTWNLRANFEFHEILEIHSE